MKQLRQMVLITFLTTILPAIAHANMGPSFNARFEFHLLFLTWIIGIVEGLLLCTLFRAWRPRVWMFRIFFSMIAANVASAWLGMQFLNSRYADQIMGDITIENLIPVFWTMVCVTFVLTMIIEFPFFLAALYGRKWLVPKAMTATLILHCISYSRLFFCTYGGEESMNMVTELQVVPALAFEMKEDYDLYYISPDGKNVLRSDLAGNDKEVIATLDMEGIPDRLCACPRKVTEEIQDNKKHKSVQRICWESGFDLYVLMNINGKYETKLLLEHFSPHSAIKLFGGEYKGGWDIETWGDFRNFMSFGDVEKWEFNSDFWGWFSVRGIEQGRHARYRILTFFVQWPVRNGTHIAGDYAVFLLGKDQICILDPEKKRIALIARGFGPVVAKPPLDNVESLPVTPEEIPQEDVQTNESTPQEL